jgi:hypothetical protein
LWIFFRRQMIQFSNALVFTKVPVAFLWRENSFKHPQKSIDLPTSQ